MACCGRLGRGVLVNAPVARHMHAVAAITRAPSPCMDGALVQFPQHCGVDVAAAAVQHEQYERALQDGVGTIVSLPSLPAPDCVFVEDTMVVLGERGVLCPTGHSSRLCEVPSVARAAAACGLPLALPTATGDSAEVAELSDAALGPALRVAWDAGVRVDGGDVLQVGGEVFVGMSARSTAAGAAYLAHAAAGSMPVHAVQLPPLPPGVPALHLKSLASTVGEGCVAVPDSPLGAALLDALVAASHRFTGWTAVLAGGVLKPAPLPPTTPPGSTLLALPVPDWQAANAVLANGTLLVRSEEEYPASAAVFQAFLRAAGPAVGTDTLRLVPAGEVAKVDGALTCCSVLL